MIISFYLRMDIKTGLVLPLILESLIMDAVLNHLHSTTYSKYIQINIKAMLATAYAAMRNI